MKKVLSVLSCLALVGAGGLALTGCGKEKQPANPAPQVAEVGTETALRSEVAKGGEIKLTGNINLERGLTINKNVTLDLNGHNIGEGFDYSEQEVGDYEHKTMFYIENGGHLTVKGSGNVTSDDLLNFWVKGTSKTDATLTIEGGNYTGDAHNVYVFNGRAEVKGGEYQASQDGDQAGDAHLLLNLNDGARANSEIEVTAGKFHGFNPGVVSEGDVTTFVKTGYESRAGKGENSSVYTVAVKPTTASSFEELQAALTNGGHIRLEGAIEVGEPIVITKDTVLDLNGQNVTETVDFTFTENGAPTNVFALVTVDGASLTVVNSVNTVGTVTTDDLYVFNVINNGVLTIEDGKYSITGTTANEAVDTIVQVVDGAAYIKGGEYKIAIETKTYMLNLLDEGATNGTASIEVTGGTFEGYNPGVVTSEPAATEITSFVPQGYTPINSQGSWTVTADAE